MPTVSVIIPNYNHERFLRKRLESVVNQSFRDIEIIYLDDASTDGSADVVKDFLGDKRIRSYPGLSNSGNPFNQWNKGVALARGKYIWIAESDDFAEPDFLEKLLPQLEEHPETAVAYCQSYNVDDNDDITASAESHTNDIDAARWTESFYSAGRDECSKYLYLRNTIPNASAVLFRKDVYESAGGADTAFRLNGDWHLWVKMLLRSDLRFVAEHLNYFRHHDASVRSSESRYGKNFEESFRVRKYIRRHVVVSGEGIREADTTLVKRAVHQSYNGNILAPQLLKIMLLALQVSPRLLLTFVTYSLKELKTRVTSFLNTARNSSSKPSADLD
jgi:glycosyltransferase involved in cell wall biosynthesis